MPGSPIKRARRAGLLPPAKSSNAAKSVGGEVSPAQKKSPVAHPDSSKNRQQGKKLTAGQKLDAIGEAALFEQVAECEYYHDIAKNAGVSRHALMNWLGAREVLYALAREARADKLAEEIISISDDNSCDVVIDEHGNPRSDSEVVARSRLRVDSRKWLASKMLPKKYGDKLSVGGDQDNPLIIGIAESIRRQRTEEPKK